ncbi:MAG: hypothetical protein WCB01_03120 [Candidatus Cybelea sp.]
MRTFAFSRRALSNSVAVASLSACSGSSMPVDSTGNATAHNATSDIAPLKNRQAFDYTGKKQMFIVPAGVNKLTVIARGGEGAGFSVYPSGNPPGFPGRVYARSRSTRALRFTSSSVAPVHTADSTAAAPAVLADLEATQATRAEAHQMYGWAV